MSGVTQATDQNIFDFRHALKATKALPRSGISTASIHAWICWGLRTACNQGVFSDKFFTSMEVVSKAVIDARAWQKANELTAVRRLTNTPRKLPLISVHNHTMCVDGAWHQASSNYGMGWTISTRDNAFDSQFSCTNRQWSLPWRQKLGPYEQPSSLPWNKGFGRSKYALTLLT
ncbi:unnamed protein product [Arabis nemorensis]|uniref:RNase H type-1 domain-containing protein n=1 Tax=Arabis nemorensis TaxID=586526 RepID=A0A565BJF7_9BRAS|nr:unnamed protein product [Arabis nemorensis]